MKTQVNEQIKTFVYKGQAIEYLLARKDVKNLNLRIKPDGTVFVSADKDVSMAEIEKLLHSRAEMILKALRKYAEQKKYAPKPKAYISGESFRLLGRDLRLKVVANINERVENDGVFLYLYVKNKDNFAHKKAMTENWIDEQRNTVYAEINEKVYARMKKYGVPYPKIKVLEMISRWGSCQHTRGIITLNKRLIEAPRNSIEYVVLHEYCHFVHPNHSKKFYAFLQMMMPDWKEHKSVLESPEYYMPSVNAE